MADWTNIPVSVQIQYRIREELTVQSPGLLNSIVALLSTLVNVMGGHDNHWSITAKVTLIMSSICTGSMFMLFSVYTWLLERIKTPKDREVARPKKPEDEKEVL